MNNSVRKPQRHVLRQAAAWLKTFAGTLALTLVVTALVGDNRAGSRDSRAAGVGPISRNMIVGHPKLVLWPLNRIGAIE